MFSIKFRVVDNFQQIKEMSLEELNREVNCIFGYINICFGTYCEGGYYHTGPLYDGEIGSELLNVWFSQLLDVVYFLQFPHTHVAMHEIETENTWIVFERDEDIVCINTAKHFPKTRQASCPGVLIDQKPSFKYETFTAESLSYKYFQESVKETADDFLVQLRALNPEFYNADIYRQLARQLERL